ncbi:hypothetical protein FRX31_017846 [Thalictrum thalictroides]|uniref:Uncharacterized protein n=1 Tax=Thalictrum thalictroides TaxID=46969 RepID=A0A7J6W7Q9_THATH|nr:hypothetical protein FRX31_017846 [Thalictrum thalictroides]
MKNAIIQDPQSEITTGSVEETENEITTEHAEENAEKNLKGSEDSKDTSFNVDEFFNFSNEGSSNLDWISKFLELDDDGTGTDGFHQNGSAPFFGEFDELNVFYM